MKASEPIPATSWKSLREEVADGPLDLPGGLHVRVRLLLCGLLLALSSSPVEGQRPPALDTTAFSAHIASVARRAQIPHVSVVVVGPEGALYEAHIGSRTSGPGPSSRGLSEGNTRFYLGAVSETLTAFALMRLVDDGLVDLDAPVTRYLPDLDFGDPDRADRLTIRHLFTHHSGLPRSGFFNRRVQEEGRLDHIDFVREPGATLEASSLDYLVLGMVLEAVSGQRFSTLMSERVFEPIGMESAVADGETARSEGVATGHRYLFGWPVATEGHPYTDIMVPAAHMAASALDTGRFLSVLLNQGRRDDVRLLTASGAKALLPTPQDPTDGTAPGAANNGWGLMAWGGDADREDEEALMRAEAWFREGVSPGFHALMAVLPGEDLGVVVLANRTGGPGPSAARELLYGVVDRALGRPGRAYVPWERLIWPPPLRKPRIAK